MITREHNSAACLSYCREASLRGKLTEWQRVSAQARIAELRPQAQT